MTVAAAPVATEPQVRKWTKAEYYRMGELGWFNGQKVELIEGQIIQQFPDREPRPREWTKAEYYAMGDLGWFRGQKAELIEGEIAVMSPQGAPHFTALRRAEIILRDAFGPAYDIRVQGPLNLGLKTEPEPDLAVVAGSFEDYHAAHPTQALLIVEISDSTLSHDRGWKASLYASRSVSDYWIVNLADQQLEVFRDPQSDDTGTREFGFRYADVKRLRSPGTVTPLALPGVAIPVAGFFG
jgi:Uma2 family endonuclease